LGRHSYYVCSLECGARMRWKCCLLALTPPQAFTRSRKPDSRIFQGISWSVSRRGRRCRDAGDKKALFCKVASERAFAGNCGEPAIALIDVVMCSSCEWRISNARDRRRRSDEEVVPDGAAALGTADIRVQSFQSRPQGSLQERAVSHVFPASPSPDAGAFLPVPGIGLHDVAMGDQHAAPIRTAQGILWLGGSAVHIHRAVIGSALPRANPRLSCRQSAVSARANHCVPRFSAQFRQKAIPKPPRIICLIHAKKSWSPSCVAMPSS